MPGHTVGERADATFRRFERHLSPGSALGAKVLGGNAIEVAASGATVVLSDGRTVIDFGSYGVTLLGHRHPAVLAAMTVALEEMPTSTRILANPATAALAAELASRCGGSLQRVWMGSDGSDAVEAALKLARRGTGRMRVLAVEGAFHGKTLGALAVTANPTFRKGLEPLLGSVSLIRRNDREAVSREIERGDVAAIVFEPIQGEAGVKPLDFGILRQWADDAHAADCFVISDEVQVGLGRCGDFSPSIKAGLQPDAVLFGKALGGGLVPLSAMVCTEAFAAPLVADPTWHTSTFGGHPLACATSAAALRALDGASANGEAVGKALEAGLAALAVDHPGPIRDVRGRGLLWGLQFATPGAAGAALIGLAQAGLLVSPCLSSKDTIRLMPPMVTAIEQVEEALEALWSVLPSLAPYV